LHTIQVVRDIGVINGTSNYYYTNTYPLPARLGKLIKNEPTTLDDNVHPTLLEDVTTERLVKLLKFPLWIAYQIRINNSISVEEVISKELKLYAHELGIKGNIMVTTHCILVKFQISNYNLIIDIVSDAFISISHLRKS
jgi:hypothetical protein